jgi:hypothetical protein
MMWLHGALFGCVLLVEYEAWYAWGVPDYVRGKQHEGFVSALCLCPTTSAGLDGLQCSGKSYSQSPVLGPVHGTVGLKGHAVPTKWVALARAISTYMHRCYTCNTVSVTSKHDILIFWLP